MAQRNSLQQTPNYTYNTIGGIIPYKDKEKQKQYIKVASNKWYQANKESVIKRQKERVKKSEAWLREYRKTLICQTCGESDSSCLDFHHRNPDEKEHDLKRMAHAGYSEEAMLREIAKCDVLCANCHRKLHSRMLNRAV